MLALDPSGPPSKEWRDLGYEYEKLGIGTKNGYVDTPTGHRLPVETLNHIMNRKQHTKIKILRMDIGGSEWPVLSQWLKKGWLGTKIEQLLLGACARV